MTYGPAYLDDAAGVLSLVPSSGGGGSTGGIAVGSNSGIMWGVNIHAGRSGVYATLGDTATAALVNTIGLKIARTDLYDASGTSQTILTNALAGAKAAGTQVLPILMADINPAITSYANETAAYNAGFAQGSTYGTNFKGQVYVWEVGNEWDGKFGGFTSFGDLASDYNATNLVKVRGLARGFIDGLKSGDPNCKVAFGSNDALSAWGWTDFLYAGGVRWDVNSIHFYSNNGTDDIQNLFLGPGTTDLLPLYHSKYGVPSWITEFNYFPGNTAEATKAAYLTSIMPVYAGISQTKFLEGVLFYELLDEGTDGSAENSYGICSTTGTLQATGTAVQTYLAAHPSVTYSNTPPFGSKLASGTYLGVTSGSANAMTVSAPAGSTLNDGFVYRMIANLANTTTTPTCNIGGTGAKTIVKRANTALAAGDYVANGPIELFYSVSIDKFILLNPIVN